MKEGRTRFQKNIIINTVDKAVTNRESIRQHLVQGGNVIVRIVLYPYAPEFHNPKFGAAVLDKTELLNRIHKAAVEIVSKSPSDTFIVMLEGDLDKVVSSCYGPAVSFNERTHYYYDGQAVYLDRSKAYPPLSCIVTIMERDYFLKSHGHLLDDAITHVVFSVNVIHGHENDLSTSIPVQGN